ncbi:MAG: hypothetical protein DCC67_05920 [Planctomycetota bacterium]|nr:MAG: hypothetical protein DCC67_05920 [Planctomycetota bacterium]
MDRTVSHCAQLLALAALLFSMGLAGRAVGGGPAEAASGGWYAASDQQPLGDPWSDSMLSPGVDGLGFDQAISAPDVELAQMLAPLPGAIAPSRTPVSQRRPSAPARGAMVSGLASVPYMIGDTSAGTCATIHGLFANADIAHPTLACSRLNVSENNTPLPVDRLYASYRHFHNATHLRFINVHEQVNLDTLVLGGEHTFWDGLFSIEARLPIEGRLSSDLATFDPDLTDNQLPTGFTGLRRTELGNASTVFKMLVSQRDAWLLSTGLGVTWPTAQDFHFRSHVVGTFDDFEPEFPAGTTLSTDLLLDMQAANETVYLAPFMAWLWSPRPRWFHQGFCQVEFAANPSTIKISADGEAQANIPSFPPIDGILLVLARDSLAELHPQTLLRLNLGMGYIVKDDPRARWVQTLTGLFEAHYATTLEDAKFSTVPSYLFVGNSFMTIDEARIGNASNRVDIVNLAAGVQANAGRFVVTNGVVAPIRKSPDRGFDFEYNLQVQRPF